MLVHGAARPLLLLTFMSPTQRTQQYLRTRGFHVANCEKKLPTTAAGWKGPLVTQDLYGFIDTLAVDQMLLLAVQSTSGSNHAAHVTKCREAPAFVALSSHLQIEVWSWAKRGPRGKRKLWTLRRESLTSDEPVALIDRGTGYDDP